jgi:hypothetical protein
MRNVEHTISTKVSADDKAAIAFFANAEHVKPSEFLRREIRDIIHKRQRGFSLDELILAELLAFKKTLIELSTAHLRDNKDMSYERARQIEAEFDSVKHKLALAAIDETESNG